MILCKIVNKSMWYFVELSICKYLGFDGENQTVEWLAIIEEKSLGFDGENQTLGWLAIIERKYVGFDGEKWN